MKRKLFLLLCALLTTVGMWAQDWTGSEVGAGYALLYNVGTEKYFTRGNGWDAQASVGGEGAAMTVELALISEGKYRIRTTTSYGVECLSDGTVYTDQSRDKSSTWTFFEVDAVNHVYNIISADNHGGGSGKYLTAEGGSSTVVGSGEDGTSENAKWKVFLYTDQQAKLLTQMASATESNPLDVTAFIKDASFGAYSDIALQCWDVTASNRNLNGGLLTNPCAETFRNNGGKISQTINGLPDGKYEVKCQGFYDVRAGSTPSKLYANTSQVNLMVKDAGTQASMAGASASFTDGDYEVSLQVTVASGSLTVGIEGQDGNWTCFDNFRLIYYGEDPTAYAVAYHEALDAAKAVDQNQTMATDVKTALNDAIDTYDEGKVDEENANALKTAIAALSTATDNANNSILDYANLSAAITAATNHTTCSAFTAYTPAFSASQTIINNAITIAQAIYDTHTAASCESAISDLANAVHTAYVNDYNIFDDDYDYDYSTLLNPDMTQWTTTNWATLTGNQHWNGQNNQNYYEQTGDEWGAGNWSHSGTETVVLPAGNYVMSIIARSSASVVSSLSVTVGSESALTTSFANKGDVGYGVTTGGVASYSSSDTYANNNNGRGWEYRFVAFNVPADNTSVTISVSASCTPKYNWVSLTNPLLKGDVHPNQILLNQIQGLLTTLKGYESLIHSDTYDTFSSDITAAEAATVDTPTADLEAIVTALQGDIATASDMYSKMTAIVENKGDLASMINGTFQSNADGWTGGSHVTWVGTQGWRGDSDSKFYERNSEGTMSYTLANMPSGSYKIVAAARTYDGGKLKAQVAGGEYGEELTGTGAAAPADGTMEINTNGVEMPYSSLGGFTSNASGHNWHWITATGTLAADGNLIINFVATGTSWMAIDDVHLYCTNLDGTAYTRTVGDGKGTINTSNFAVTADIIMENPNTILRSTGKVTTASGDMNNNQYNSSRITKLVLYDGYDFTNSNDNYGLDNGATLYRNIPADTWCTLMVPFYPTNLNEMKVPASLTEGVLSFDNAPAKDMNDSPMLVKSTEGVTAITGLRNSTYGINKGTGTYGEGAPMVGVYESGTVPMSDASNTNYIVNGSNLYKVNSTVNIKTFRAYFTVESGSSDARIILNFDDDPTAINAIEAVQPESGALKDGKYFIDNKIVIVKNGVKYGANGQKLN